MGPLRLAAGPVTLTVVRAGLAVGPLRLAVGRVTLTAVPEGLAVGPLRLAAGPVTLTVVRAGLAVGPLGLAVGPVMLSAVRAGLAVGPLGLAAVLEAVAGVQLAPGGKRRRAVPARPGRFAVMARCVGAGRAVRGRVLGRVRLMTLVGLARPEPAPGRAVRPPRAAAPRPGPADIRSGQGARLRPPVAALMARAGPTGRAALSARTLTGGVPLTGQAALTSGTALAGRDGSGRPGRADWPGAAGPGHAAGRGGPTGPGPGPTGPGPGATGTIRRAIGTRRVTPASGRDGRAADGPRGPGSPRAALGHGRGVRRLGQGPGPAGRRAWIPACPFGGGPGSADRTFGRWA